ncbi:MAG: transglycosylase domain-containing protein [Candidatus Hydrogenedentes bacterium]|nr:transglycosylase domain-containing protein [Candidatus Hydrogenedentota bacterium]
MGVLQQILASDQFQTILAGALGTIVGGVGLTILAFAFGDVLFGVPRVNGLWFFVTTTTRARRGDYEGMKVAYRALVWQEGNHLKGSGEKIWDIAHDGNVTRYEFAKRVRIQISGSVRKRYLFRSEVVIHIDEDGRRRPTSAIHALKRKRRGSFGGTFIWTASDSHGEVEWSQWQPNLPTGVRPKPVRRLRAINWPFGVIVYATGRVLASVNAFSLQHRQAQLMWTCQSLEHKKVPSLAIEMLILGEDKRYYSHAGVDPLGLARAIWRLLIRHDRQGGSTIEQQFVRTATSDLEYSLRRKLREMALATLVSRRIDKSRIPHLYLSIAYFGYGMVGIEAACRRLQKDLDNLSPADAAELIARLKYPQPKTVNAAWSEKLSRRSNHLLDLYQRGIHGQTYESA